MKISTKKIQNFVFATCILPISIMKKDWGPLNSFLSHSALQDLKILKKFRYGDDYCKFLTFMRSVSRVICYSIKCLIASS